MEKKQKEEGLWTMYFDGSVEKFGPSAGVYIISPIRDFKALSYKLTFECTNNVVEYEYLLLGLNALKDLGAKRVHVVKLVATRKVFLHACVLACRRLKLGKPVVFNLLFLSLLWKII